MSDEELKSLPALEGYVNLKELKLALLQGFGQASLGGMAAYVVMLMGESAHLWYTGPAAPTVVLMLSSVAAYFRSKSIAKRYLAEGERPFP